MPFVDDLTITLPYPKSDLEPLTVEDPTKHVEASEWNDLNEAVDDCRDVMRGAGGRFPINVKDHDAQGDVDPITELGTDDSAAFLAAYVEAQATDNMRIRIPPGNYLLEGSTIFEGARGLRIEGSAFVTIYYKSDDLTIVPAAGYSYGQARSGFLFKNCRDVTVENIDFVGGDAKELNNQQVGYGIYATRCQGTRVTNCRSRRGAGLFAQDATLNSNYTTGNAIAVTAGIVTLTNAGDANGAFHSAMTGLTVTIAQSVNPVNDGVFEILEVISATQLRYRHADAIAEAAPASTAIWVVNDGDEDTIIEKCRWHNARGASYTGSGGTFRGCRFYRPMTQDQAGVPKSFSITGTTVTMTDAHGTWTGAAKGRYVKIGGSTSAGNDGVFLITSATAKTSTTPATMTYENAAGVTENRAKADTSRWWIAGGERSNIGAGLAAIASSSGVVTFTSAVPIFAASDLNSSLCITDATTPANSGNFMITRVISSTVVQYVNSVAVSEAYAKVFLVDGFDNVRADSIVGPAIASTSTGVAANALTDSGLAMVTNAYAARLLIDSAGRQWKIVTNTGTVFTLGGSGTPAAGAYTVTAGTTHGSTHALYFFAGRNRILVEDCHIWGSRGDAVKWSGTTSNLESFEVKSSVFTECAGGVTGGADDSNIHALANVHHSRFVNCGNGRVGWNHQTAIQLFGVRGCKVEDNQVHRTHDVIAAHLGAGSIGGFYGIMVGRYTAGVSQPSEDASLVRNVFTRDPNTTSASRIADAAIYCDRVGQRGKWRESGATLTKAGSVMTLTDGAAKFSAEDVGASIQISFAPDSGNNSATTLYSKVGEWTVASVPSTTTLTFVNALGVGGGVSAGTYRIKPKTERGGALAISQNQFIGFGQRGVKTVACLAPQVLENMFDAMDTNVSDDGSVALHIARNIEAQAGGNNARITITSATAWPIVYDNFVTNGALAGGNLTCEFSATKSDWGIGVDGTTSVDYPLRGKSGRQVRAAAFAENVFAFGKDIVSGDTFAYGGTAYTYRASGAVGNQFSTFAGLVTLLNDRGDATCVDYGSSFSTPVTTGHLRVRSAAAQVAPDLFYIDNVNVLNATALVIPRNDTAGGESMQYERGGGIAGPTSVYLVAWTMQASFSGMINLAADTDAAVTLLLTGWRKIPTLKNSGCCEVIKHFGTEAGGEEFRWSLS
jgi:hypothetical protein